MEETKLPIQESVQESRYADAYQPEFFKTPVRDYIQPQRPVTEEGMFGTHVKEAIKVLKETIKPEKK